MEVRRCRFETNVVGLTYGDDEIVEQARKFVAPLV
jgi:hypothetical protein